MATAKQLRELADLQATRDRALAHAMRCSGIDGEKIDVIATILTGQADDVRTDRRKSWQGASAALDAAAERVRDLLVILDANPAPTNTEATSSGPNPHREPLPPGHRSAQFVSPLAYEPGMIGQHIPGPDAFVTPRVAADLRKAIDEADTTDAKLDVAFGPLEFPVTGDATALDPSAIARLESLPTVTREISTVGGMFDQARGEVMLTMSGTIDPSTIAVVPVVHITRESEGEFAYCPATGGQRAYRGAANCPECIELHTDRYANMRWTKFTSDAPPAPPATTEIKINDKWTDVTGHVVRIGDPIPEPLNVVDPARPIVPMPMQPRPRMTMEQVIAHGRARARGVDHRSHSQLVEYEGCGTKYAIGNLARVPSWWNVGGNAVHSAIESINRTFAYDGTTLPSRSNVADLWRETFHITVAEAEYASDVPHEAWAAAKKGAEAYDWWRVNGEDMVDRWAVRLGNMADGQGWQIAVINGEPVIEYQYRLQIHGSAVPDLGYIDLALFDGSRYLIIDIKAGGSTDHDHMQVGGQYRWGLWSELKGAVPADLIDGVFWQARTGETIEATRWDYATMCARIAAMDVQERAGIYAPKTGWYCKGCQVRDLCPAGPAS